MLRCARIATLVCVCVCVPLCVYVCVVFALWFSADLELSDWASAAEILHVITAPGSKEFDMKGLCGLQLATCYRTRPRSVCATKEGCVLGCCYVVMLCIYCS